MAEEGTHQELMFLQCGLYRGMFTVQAAPYGLTAPGTPVPATRRPPRPVPEDAS
ncbi:hypothetical protein ACIQ7D_04680 [Streptomyces sp. NPDC096310]|uniref:hypothetical protein n=1 Tax=Streptomyces sp. NPDC096310 TaxID=3366082 RepID=UPI0037FFCED8